MVGNQADSIRQSLRELRNAGLIGAVLSFFMLLLFLRHLPTTLIVSLAVPASLLVTLGAMYFLGFTLNILTMMGMLLAIGMLVDNAVVITESVFRHRQLMPDRPIEATVAGVKEVGVATLAGTFSTIIVFLPLVFGEKNQMSIFLVHVAVPIVVAMLASLVVAQTLIPMLTARMPPPPEVSSTSLFGRLQRRYTATLDWALGAPEDDGGDHAAAARLAGAAVRAQARQGGPVPAGSEPHARCSPTTSTAPTRWTGSSKRSSASRPTSRRTRSASTSTPITRSGCRTSASTRLYLKPKDEATVAPEEVMRRVVEGMPEIIIGKPSFQFDMGAAGATAFTLQLTGESTERLAELSHDVAKRLSSVPGLEAVRSEAGTGEQEVQVIVNRDRASQLGLTTQQIALTVAGAMRGDRLPELRTSEREITMRLAFRENDRQSVDDLGKVPIMLADGSRTELGAVADFVVRPSDRRDRARQPPDHRHDQRQPRQGHHDGGGTRARASRSWTTIRCPPATRWKFGRGFEENDKAVKTMTQNMILAVVLIFLVMASLFESALYPLSIITSILFAIVGSIWFLTLTGTTITMMAMIGFMILIGVVVNIGIVLIAHVIDLREAGLPRREAILQAGRDRLRPILMTTLTTLLGMLPLAIGDAQVGGGGEGPAYYPMARAIMGGLGFSAAVSLLIVPMFYVWFDDLNEWRLRVFAKVAGRSAPAMAVPASRQWDRRGRRAGRPRADRARPSARPAGSQRSSAL